MKAISILLAAFGALLISTSVFACSCKGGVSFEQALADAQVVVLAELKDRKEFADKKMVEGTFVVKQTFKGIVANEFKMTTGISKADCGISFNKKQPYLLILDGKNWTVGSCDHGGPIPTDLEHDIVHEVEYILKDPAKAIAQANAANEQEIWIKRQGPEMYILHTRLRKCGELFTLDKAALEKQEQTIVKAKKLWHELMVSRLDNPKVRSMLGNILNKQALKAVEQDLQAGKLDKIMCEALVMDGELEQSFKKMQQYH